MDNMSRNTWPVMAGGLFLETTQFPRLTVSNADKFFHNNIHREQLLCAEKDCTNLRKYLCLRAVKFFHNNIHREQLLFSEKGCTNLRKYLCLGEPEERSSRSGFKAVGNNLQDLKTYVTSWLVPEGYPESVAPSYAPYMQWRALQYFFGGSISVFTTHSLLHALGISNRETTSLAINWVIKDVAGRIGKLLFARKGKKFDCNLKQLRFTGHILMEAGALVELATSLAPSLSLPLACAANVVKSIAAVSSTSTRTPIYKAFALRDNIGDVTAKGESTSNIADLVGTGLGILISGKNKLILPIFFVLSCGYLLSSYQEVKSVILPTMNRPRFGVAVWHFLNTGQVPSVSEVNSKECIFTFPWAQQMHIELGVRVVAAFQNSEEFLAAEAMFKAKNYLITYNRRRKRACVVLKEDATSEDVIEGAFQAYMLLYGVNGASQKTSKSYINEIGCDQIFSVNDAELLSKDAVVSALSASCRDSLPYYKAFKEKAASQGWIITESLLNPGGARIYRA